MGVSTRLMGALVMTHSDQRLVLPPNLAPIQVVMFLYIRPMSNYLEIAAAVSILIQILEN
jgi:prolyl-tRNA synthetase